MIRTRLAVVLLSVVLGIAALAVAWGNEVPSPPHADTGDSPEPRLHAVDANVREADAPRRTALPPATATDAACEAPVVVTVLDQHGACVEGAEVAWLPDGFQSAHALVAAQPPERRTEWLDDPERLAQRFGSTGRTDQHGQIAVTGSGEHRVVHARDGDRYGRLGLSRGEAEPPGGHRLVLEHDRSLRVQVLTADGQPASDVPIRCRLFDETGAPMLRDDRNRDVATRAPDGIACFPHLQVSRRFLTGPGTSWRAAISLPGLDDPGLPFDGAALPAEPLVLRLPPSGAVRVRFAATTPRGGAGETVILFADDPAALADEPRGCWREADGAGVVVFGHVPLGQSFVARAWFDTWRQQRFAGPTRAGEIVDVELAPPSDAALLEGRFVDPTGTPVAGAAFGGTFALQTTNGQAAFTYELESGADGRFAAMFEPGELQATTLVERCDGVPPRQLAVPTTTLVAGRVSLGDVVVHDGPWLVTGRFVIDGATRPRDVSWHISRATHDGDPTVADVVPPLASFVLDDGRFGVLARPEPGNYHLVVEASGHRPGQSIGFAPGAELVVPIDGGAALTAVVRWPAEATRIPCVVLQDASSPTAGQAPVAWPVHLDGDRHRVSFRGIQPGRYALHVRWRPDEPTWHEVLDVVVPPPPGGDPRLAAIDLRPRVVQGRLRVHGKTADLAHSTVEARRPDLSRTDLVFHGRGGVFDWVALTDAKLLVCCPGHEPVLLDDLRSTHDVVLTPWRTRALRLRQLPTSDGTRWAARALPVPAPDDPTPWSFEWHPVVDGATTLTLRSGPHRLWLMIERTGQPTRTFLASDTILYAGPEVLELDVGATAEAAAAVAESPRDR